MRKETVTIKIDKKGVMTVEADGFVGCGCDVINDLEMELAGRNLMQREEKAERYQYETPNGLNVNL